MWFALTIPLTSRTSHLPTSHQPALINRYTSEPLDCIIPNASVTAPMYLKIDIFLFLKWPAPHLYEPGIPMSVCRCSLSATPLWRPWPVPPLDDHTPVFPVFPNHIWCTSLFDQCAWLPEPVLYAWEWKIFQGVPLSGKKINKVAIILKFPIAQH